VAEASGRYATGTSTSIRLFQLHCSAGSNACLDLDSQQHIRYVVSDDPTGASLTRLGAASWSNDKLLAAVLAIGLRCSKSRSRDRLSLTDAAEQLSQLLL
jgi:hypothetical protein